MNRLRILSPSDLDQLIAVYQDAVISQAAGHYSPAQISAWSNQASSGDVLARCLRSGHGVGIAQMQDPQHLDAFGILEPSDRLSLLYCRGHACRRGLASAILDTLEAHARAAGIPELRTEASQLSRPLLQRRGWRITAEETVTLGGEAFLRWRMIKQLCSAPPGG